jgi:hypothetical protein
MSLVNFTKEGIAVEPGQVWKDLDVRNLIPRKVRIDAVGDGYVTCTVLEGSQPGQRTRMAIRRMHKGATGWALVPDGAA